MNTTSILGIDFGTSGLRFQRAVLGSDRQLKSPPQEPALQQSEHGVLPSVLEVDLQRQEILSYGRTALGKLRNRGSGGTFIQEFKPCLGQAPEDVASQGRPAIAQAQTCLLCGAACSGGARFCARCGGPLTSLAESDSSVLFQYSQDEAFLWAGKLLARVCSDLQTRVYNEPLSAANGWEIVAGVPVHWKAATRQRFQSLLCASFENDQVRLVSEPEAAVYYHLSRETLRRSIDGSLLLVDIGAGTTDIVLGRLTDGGRRLVGSSSYGERYGGGDFDTAIAGYVAQLLHIPVDQSLPPALKLASKDLKELFSAAVAGGEDAADKLVVLRIDGQQYAGMVTLDRSTFESQHVAGALVSEFGAMIGRALTHFSTTPENIASVILTGGGAHWYFVQEALNGLFAGKPVVTGDAPERAIARGLALAPIYLPEHASAMVEDSAGIVSESPTQVKRGAAERAGGAAALIAEGRSLAESSHWDLAQSKYQEAIRLDRESVEARCALGDLLGELCSFDAARAEFEEALRLDPLSSEAHRGMGSILSEQNDKEMALSYRRKAVRLDPNNAKALIEFGEALKADAAKEEAREHLEKGAAVCRDLLMQQPGSATHRCWLAMALIGLGKHDEAVAVSREVAEQSPRYSLARVCLGAGLFYLEDLAGAETEMREYVRLNPRAATGHMLLASIELKRISERQGDIDTAITQLQEAVRLNPHNVESHCLLADALKVKGDHNNAITEYREAVRLEPDNPDYRKNLGYSYYYLKQYEAAMSEYREAIRLKPDNPDYHNTLGACYRNLNQYEAAIPEYREAIRLERDNADYYYGLGLCHYFLNQYEAAISEYREAVRLKPDEPRYHNNLGECYYFLNQYEAAIPEFREAIRLKPDNSTYHHNLGHCYYGLKQYEAAIPAYREAIRFKPDEPVYATPWANVTVI